MDIELCTINLYNIFEQNIKIGHFYLVERHSNCPEVIE